MRTSRFTSAIRDVYSGWSLVLWATYHPAALLWLFCLGFLLSGSATLALAQTPANIENGFKPYGSYDGTNLDTINVMNGNLMLHVPMPWTYPQRGSDINPHNLLTVTSKTWHEQCNSNNNAPPTCYWTNGWGLQQVLALTGTGLGFDHTMDMALHRVWESQSGSDGNGPTSYSSFGYYLDTADGSTHQLWSSPSGPFDPNGDPLALESIDTTGFHVTLTNVGSDGTPSGAVVTDRHGNQYVMGKWAGTCTHSTVGGNGGTTTVTCTQVGTIASITDVNGNVYTVWNGSGSEDTMGRPFLSSSSSAPASNSAAEQCVGGGLTVTSATTFTYPGPGGGTNQITACYATLDISTAFGVSGILEAQNAPGAPQPLTAQVLVTLIMADGTKWTFSYDSYMDVTQVGLPLGGSISYTWTTVSTSSNCGANKSRAVTSRSLNDNNGHMFTWNYSWRTPGNTSLTNTITDPLGNDVDHVFSALDVNSQGVGCTFYETSTQYYQGTGSGRQLLKQIDTTYSSAILLDQTGGGADLGNVVATSIKTTVYPSGKVSLVTKSYDSGLGTNAPIFGDVTQELDYDWGQGSPGALLREVDTTYEWQVNSGYLAAQLLDLPASVVTKDGNGNRVAETDYTYDESQYLTASSISTQHGAAPNPSPVRGNLTTVSKWLNTSSNPVVSHTNWYDTGELYQAMDPLGNTTTHTYSSSFAGAYPTQTCNALSQCVNGNYDFNTGLLTSFTDANGNTSSYSYDFLSRLTSAQLSADPSGNHPQTTLTYSAPNSFPFNIQRQKTITTSLSDISTAYFDGLGRPYETQHATPNGNATVVTTYDALDHPVSVTNPYFSTSDPTYGVTTTQYDGIGRVTKTTKQDNSVVTALYNQTSGNSPNGDCTLTTDEAGNPRKSCLDSIGRLIEVDEPQPSSGSMTNPYVTLYSYDALGNLLSVNQKGDGSQAARVRTFTYDSLSRLLTATNPESGQISYSYDANGNVLQKTSPAPNQTGSATQTISYCYDALNRVTGRAYAAQSCPLSSPVVTYSYDSGTNGIGHLTSLTDQPGSGNYGYDALGRIASEQRIIAGNSKTLSYTYNLDNSVATLTYPSGAVVTYTPDAAGRVLSAVDSANNINYVTAATYSPDNSLTAFLGGQSNSFAGITNSFSFNPRLQPVTMAAVAPDCTGSGCSASVTISGSLGTAVSATGTAPPNAASGSALSGYEDSAGVNHWLYEGSNDHLYEVYWNNNGSGRGYADATVETGGPLAAQTTALSTYLDNSQVPHWIYEDGAQHMQLFWIYSGTWGSVDNTVHVGSPAMATGSALTSKEDTSCMQHWAFFGSSKDLYEMHQSGTNGCLGSGVSGYSDGTAATGAPPAAPSSAMSMYFDNSQVAHWIYEDSSQHIQLLWWLNSGSWGNIDVTTTTGGPVAATGSALTSREDTNCLQHWAYLGTNQHLYDAYHDDSSGCTGTPASGYSDGTAAAGAPAAAPGSALSMYFDNSQVAHWIYEDSSQHIQLLWYAGGSWGHLDVTATAGSPLAAPGSALASGEDTNCLQRWLYFGSNQHLYEVHAQGNAGGGCSGNDVWGYSDVTAATPNEVIDSGTVSLNVGNFTATACFGSSSNPACTGKPVNDSPSQVAAALATALNASGSPVTATASGATINMTWTATGSAATPVSPLITTHDNPTLFPGPSFTSPAVSFGGGTGGSTPVFNMTYNFSLGNGDNGNVIGITNNRDTTRSQSFTYDYLNRLTSAQNAGTNCNLTTANGKTEYWGNSYGYDAWGNLLQKTVSKCSAENLSVTALSNNQLSGYGYDAAGNMTHDATTGNTYTFDQENRITGAAGYTYTYDADGNRVEKSNGSTGTIYWYMSPGIVAESDLSGNLKSEYVFFDGERVARKDFSGNTTSVSYYFSDHLKTASVITNSAGVITEDEDYYPWGGELQFVNSDSNHYKFTGKERDSESGLDYFGARYYGNWLGRWASPDPLISSAHAANPQSWNRYTYVYDNPLRHVDPDGRQALDVSNPAVQKLIKTLKAVPGKTAGSFKGGLVQTVLERTEGNLLGEIFGYNPMAIQGGLSPAEFKQLNKASAYEKGALMAGVGQKNQPGIDAVDLTNGKGVSLKEAANVNKIQENAGKALASADNAGFHDVNLYIDAPNVLKADASGLNKIQNVLGTGTITKVVIFTKDGSVEYTPTAEQQKQIECKRAGKSSCP